MSERPKIPRCYLVELSNKRSVQIDEDEFAKVRESLVSGQFCRVRQGLINPSFVIDIVLDEKRMNDIRADIKRVEEHNDFDRNYNGGKDQWRYGEIRPLKDIFADVNMRLEDGKKLLSG